MHQLLYAVIIISSERKYRRKKISKYEQCISDVCTMHFIGVKSSDL